ncbi:hypothetical protein [Pseudomonas syringae]
MTNFLQTSTWRANFRPHLDGVRCRWDDLRLNLVAGKCYQLTLEFDGSYLIGDAESPIAICRVSNSDMSGIEIAPEEGRPIQMVEDPNTFSNLVWNISTNQSPSNSCSLHFEMPNYPGMPNSPSIPVRIEDMIIGSVSCDRPVTYAGYKVSAQALVIATPSGTPVSGVPINASYEGKALPESVTDKNGIAQFDFVAANVGENDLIVTQGIGAPDSKTLRIVVQEQKRATIYRMTRYPFELHIGQTCEFAVFVADQQTLKPIAGREVRWRLNDFEIGVSFTGEDGRATVQWLATGIIMGIVEVWAYVFSQTDTAKESAQVNVVRSPILE